MTGISRRTFLALSATIVAGCTSSGDDATSTTARRPSEPQKDTALPPTSPPASATAPATTARTTTSTTTTNPPTTSTALAVDPFRLGVSSGDPDERSVVLWTRLTGDELPAAVDVVWEVAADDAFDEIMARGVATATEADGHSLHVVAELTGPGWYRFRAGGFTSPVGRASPTPGGAEAAATVRIASASCQHFETGFYAAHRDLAAWAPDLVVFLGDFIYEGPARPVNQGVVRSHDGPEPIDLAGYRARYAHYLADADLQAARAVCPWIPIWDDHEVENNYAGLVPEDPADAASFPARRDAAYRAWWEHMPVRLPPPVPGAPMQIDRVTNWGGLVDLVLLDGRQFRSDQACGSPVLSLDPPCPEASDPARTMLGPDQEARVGAALAASQAVWTTICQQTVLSDVRLNGAILNYDQWDGYAPARDRLLAQAAAAARVIVLTGDIHLSAVGRLPGVGVEFVTTAISSAANVDVSLQPVVESFPTLVGVELVRRGYVRHTVSPERWTAEYRLVADVTRPDSSVETWRTFTVDAATPDDVRG